MGDVSVETKESSARERAISSLIDAAALEASALAGILSATGDEIHAVSKLVDTTKRELAELNTTIEAIINAASQMEEVILKKLELIKAWKTEPIAS